jgi:hypothetical protein
VVPPYNPNGTQTENNIIHIHWQKNKELKDQMDNCNKALIALTKNKFESKYRLQLQSLFTGIPDCTFIAFYNRIFDKWGRVNTFDIDANTERMRKTWDPTTDNMTDLLQQIREGSIFAYYIKFPKQDDKLVQIGERLILETGLFGHNSRTGSAETKPNAHGPILKSSGRPNTTYGPKPAKPPHNMVMTAMQKLLRLQTVK